MAHQDNIASSIESGLELAQFDRHKGCHSRMLKISEVISRTGLSRSTIYNKIDCKSAGYDSTFPKQAKLGARAVAWDEGEIEHWIQSQLSARK